MQNTTKKGLIYAICIILFFIDTLILTKTDPEILAKHSVAITIALFIEGIIGILFYIIIEFFYQPIPKLELGKKYELLKIIPVNKNGNVYVLGLDEEEEGTKYKRTKVIQINRILSGDETTLEEGKKYIATKCYKGIEFKELV